MAEPSLSPAPVSVRERGYTHGGASSWWDEEEETPEVAWPDSIRVYDRMRRSDAQCSSVLRAVSAPILGTGWWVDGRGCRDEVTEHVATDFGLPIRGTDPDEAPLARRRGRFSWNDHNRLSLLMLPFGHSIFEQVYRFDTAGRVHLKKLAYRPARTISKFNVARDGGLISIEQYPATNAGGRSITTTARNTPISVDRLVAYVLDREGGNWQGQSVLRAAYKNWLLKDRALRQWSSAVRRQGMGLPVYTAPEKATDDDIAKGRQIAQQAAAGDDSGAGLPHGAKLELLGVQGAVMDPEKFVRYQDEQIARAVLAHFLNLGTQTGSWALGSTFADFFTLSLQAVAVQQRDTTNDYAVEDLVDRAFSPDEPAPRIVFDDIGRRQGDSALDEMRRLAGLEDDDDMAEFIRTKTSLPPTAAA